MKEWFERFSGMDVVTWVSVLCIAISATIVRLLVEAKEITLRGFIVGSFLAAFLAYLTALYCINAGMSGQAMGVTVGFVTYQSVNILTGIGKLGAAFAKDPFALLQKLRDSVRR